MNFASDNISGASPRVLQAVVMANDGMLPSYGVDHHTKAAERMIADLFGGMPATAFVATGTAANALALATVVPPGGVVFCHTGAHISEEECAAPEFFMGAGKLVGVAGPNGKIDPEAFRATLQRFPRGVPRQAQAAALSLSQATEAGTLYGLDEIRALAALAHEAGLAVHMDGARFSNAVAALGCTPAAMSRDVGVDVLSFGATKNGTLACEAVIVFDEGRAGALPFLQKRGGHVLSKGRFLGAQMSAYLADNHWLDLATHANAMAQRLAGGLISVRQVRMPWRRDVNEVFVIMPRALEASLKNAGAVFYGWDPTYLPVEQRPTVDEVFVRLLCSFATAASDVDAFLAAVVGDGPTAAA